MTMNRDQCNKSVPIRRQLQSRNDMSQLDKHLNCLNGKISLVKTKYTEDGKKVRIIKIKRKKSKDPSNNNLKQPDLKQLIADVRADVKRTVVDNEHLINQRNKVYKQVFNQGMNTEAENESILES
jgi:hypothetical protein